MVVRIAVIEICAQDVLMKIYDIQPKKGMKNVDSIRQKVALGKDTYGEGRVSSEILDKLCTALKKCRDIMQEYRVGEYWVLATGAVREAKNCAMVVDQIRIRTGLEVRVLSNSEQRFLRVKGVICQEGNFAMQDKGTILVDIGSGSIQISIYIKKVLTTTQNIMLGVTKIGEMISDLPGDISVVEQVLKELIDNDIQTFEKMFLKEHNIKNILLVGDNLMSYIRKTLEGSDKKEISVDDIKKLYESVKGKTPGEISYLLGIPIEYASTIMPVLILAQTLVAAAGAETVSIPQSDLCDGFAVDYMEKTRAIRKSYDFEEDIIASSRTICKRYKGNQLHAQSLELMSCIFFDVLNKYHGLGERERLLLRISAILHDCGKFISMSNPGDCAYQIIMSTEILGLSHAEREMVANIVRYNTKEMPVFDEYRGKLSSREYLTVMKLVAILRICNALDRSHKQKFSDIKLVFKGSKLIITTYYQDDITLEKTTLAAKAPFFEEVYGLQLETKQKKKK